jgi:hypothetical protein
VFTGGMGSGAGPEPVPAPVTDFYIEGAWVRERWGKAQG